MAYGNAIPKRLAVGQLANNATSGTLYTVPVGMGAVIKRIHLWVGAGVLTTTSNVSLYVNNLPVAMTYPSNEANNTSGGQTYHTWSASDMNLALNAGDVITLNNASGSTITIVYNISGVEFTV